MTRKVAAIALILLATFLPLVAMPLPEIVVAPLLTLEHLATICTESAPSVALFSLSLLRAPPAR